VSPSNYILSSIAGALEVNPFFTDVALEKNAPSEKNRVNAYRYGFNGMEKDDEIKGIGNQYTSEFRALDPRLGRWLSVDPVVHHHLSPYNSFDNNPIYWVDPRGGNSTKYEDEEGNLLAETDDGSDAVVVVTDEQAQSFFEDYRDSDLETINSKEWNYKWKSNLSGRKWNDAIENNQSYWATDGAKRNAFRYLQTGDIKYWSDAVSEHTAAFRDPISMATGVVGFAYFSGVARLSSLAQKSSSASRTIHDGGQGKHIPGHNNYIKGRSILKVDAQGLLDDLHRGNVASVHKINDYKLRVDFGREIGTYINPETGASAATTRGIVTTSKNGAHIIPSAP